MKWRDDTSYDMNIEETKRLGWTKESGSQGSFGKNNMRVRVGDKNGIMDKEMWRTKIRIYLCGIKAKAKRMVKEDGFSIML